MKIYALEICMSIALILCFIFSSSAEFEQECQEIRGDVLRLHVLANSDSESDQRLKLEVRDAVLKAGESCFSGRTRVADATQQIEENLLMLLKSADEVIHQNGYDYEVSINIETCFFSTRTYDDVTLPAGMYKAVRVLIGEGEGHNWWCVMFPAMCLSTAEGEAKIDDVLNEDELEVVKSDPSFEVRFWFVEKFEEFREWVDGLENAN